MVFNAVSDTSPPVSEINVKLKKTFLYKIDIFFRFLNAAMRDLPCLTLLFCIESIISSRVDR